MKSVAAFPGCMAWDSLKSAQSDHALAGAATMQAGKPATLSTKNQAPRKADGGPSALPETVSHAGPDYGRGAPVLRSKTAKDEARPYLTSDL
jgi:hypothetical protein